jgi:HD-GYP domain-containing protein (c-di-GMP phosphodiesterase class II)
MIREIEFLGEAFAGIMHHHERLDGLGYPMGLRGSEIPEFARAIAVADAFDSMTTTRSYRGARTPDEALEELRRCAGSQFEPSMVEALVAALAETGWQGQLEASVDPTSPEFEFEFDEAYERLPRPFDHDDPTASAPHIPTQSAAP